MPVPSAETQKIVLVTGCSTGGIGFALYVCYSPYHITLTTNLWYRCEEFAARGCIVYATSRRLESMEGFRNLNIRKHVLDVTSGDDIDRTVQTILAETGKIDIVVNNAGAIAIGESSPLAFCSGFGYLHAGVRSNNLAPRSRS